MSAYATKDTNELGRSPGGGGSARVWMVVLAFVVVGTAVPVTLHSQRYGVLNIGQLVLALFLWINVLVTFSEISLYLRIKLIKERYADFVPTYRGREFDRLIEFIWRRSDCRTCRVRVGAPRDGRPTHCSTMHTLTRKLSGFG